MYKTPPQTKGYPNIVKFNWSIYSSSTYSDFQKKVRRTFQQIGLEHKNALYSAIYISFRALQIKKQDNFVGAFLIFMGVLTYLAEMCSLHVSNNLH